MNTKKLFENAFIIGKEINYPKDMVSGNYLIFYPSDGYYLPESLFYCIFSVLEKLDMIIDVNNIDIEFLNDKFEDISESKIRKISTSDYEMYKTYNLLFENCIFDSKFRWSISIFQDFWGLIYAPKECLSVLLEEYDFKRDIQKFRTEIIDNIEDENVKYKYYNLINGSFLGRIESLIK